jgi:single-strand DNA-binding protein
MLDTQVTVVGNVVTDPRLNFTKDHQAFTTFRIASTPRRFDRGSGEWRDGQTLFLGVTCWRGLAENTATCLKKGQAVIVVGRLSERAWETREGEKRSSCEIDAAAVGPDLGRAVAFVKRAERSIPAPEQSSSSDEALADEADSPETGHAELPHDEAESIDWSYPDSTPEVPGALAIAGDEPAEGAPAPELMQRPDEAPIELAVLVGAGGRGRGRSGGS